MPSYEKIDYDSPDGAQFGSSTAKIGFYGAVPQSQYTTVGAASTYIVHGQTSASASSYGFNSAAAVTSLVLQVSTITVALKALGIIS